MQSELFNGRFQGSVLVESPLSSSSNLNWNDNSRRALQNCQDKSWTVAHRNYVPPRLMLLLLLLCCCAIPCYYYTLYFPSRTKCLFALTTNLHNTMATSTTNATTYKFFFCLVCVKCVFGWITLVLTVKVEWEGAGLGAMNATYVI